MQIILKSKTAIVRFFGPFRMKISGLLITLHPSDLRITDTSKHAYLLKIVMDLLTQKLPTRKFINGAHSANSSWNIQFLAFS